MKVLLKFGYYLFILVSLCILLLQPKPNTRRQAESLAYGTTEKSQHHLMRSVNANGDTIPMLWTQEEFPILVWYTPSLRHFAKEEYILDQAVSVWNRYLGREIFEIVNYRPMNGVTVDVVSNIHRNSDNRELLGICYYRHNNHSMTRADIMISARAIDNLILFRTLVHELGHSIGFAHTNDNRYIMFPVIDRNGLDDSFVSTSYMFPELVPDKAKSEFEANYSFQD